MHDEALEWVRVNAPAEPGAVLDIGGHDNNGSPRALFATDDYTVLDLVEAHDVDIVADAAIWTPDRQYDTVVCTEVFEHTPEWPRICQTVRAALRPGGLFIATMAGPGRPAHGAWGAPGPAADEWYENVQPSTLRAWLEHLGFTDVKVDVQSCPADVRVVARRE